MSGAVFSTCYETVHCTVSPKFTCEFGATCLLCFAQFTPFPHQIFNLSGTPNRISFYSTARFSHFIDSLKLYSNRNLYSINNNFQVYCCFFVYKLVLYIHYIKNGLARLVRERNLWAKNAPIRVRNLAAIL